MTTGIWSSSGGVALVGLFWQTICAVLIPGSWKWATNWRIILVSSQLVCSNLNHRAKPRRLETRSGNSISCVPNTCHHSVFAACPENLSKTATVSLDTCLHHGTQQSSCHNLDFSAWSCLCPRDLNWSQRGWQWHSTGCGPSSAQELLCDPLWPFWVHQGSVQLDQISLKIGLYSRLGGSIAVQVDRGKEKSAKQGGVMWGIKMLLEILSISSELSILPMPPPLY